MKYLITLLFLLSFAYGQMVSVVQNNICTVSFTASLTPIITCADSGAGTSTGGITLTAVAGFGTKTYSRDNGSTFGGTGTFTGLTAGTYTCWIKDAWGCTSSASEIVQHVTYTDTFTFVTVNPSTCGTANGKITLTPSGGSGSYNYTDNNSTYQSSGIFSSLLGGNYSCRVRDASGGCYGKVQVVCVGHSLGCCYIWEPKDELLWVNLDFNHKYYIK